MENVTPVARSDIAPRFLQWSPIVLGAFAATAVSSVLLTFAVTIGLGVTSAAPTWRDTSAALAILSGLYLIIQAVVSFGLGGYIAGHTRTSTGPAAVEETEHVDGAHGLGTWALAVVMGAILAALIGAATINRTSSMRGPAQASAAEPLLSYELDRLFRAGRRAPNVDLGAERAEAGPYPAHHLGSQRPERGRPHLSHSAGWRAYRPCCRRRGTKGRQCYCQRQDRHCTVTTQHHHPRLLGRNRDPAWRGGGLGRCDCRRTASRRRAPAGVDGAIDALDRRRQTMLP